MSIFAKTRLDAMIQFRLSKDGLRRLRELAREEGVTIAAIIRRGLDLYLENRERSKAEGAQCDDGNSTTA